MDTATKRGTDATKTASKRVVQKNAEATRDLIGNKLLHQAKQKVKKKEKKNKKSTYHQKKTANY